MRHPYRRQAGAALVTSLIILIVLAMIGTSAIATGFVQLRMSGNSQEQAIAAAAAQSAINTALRMSLAGQDEVADKSGHILFESYVGNSNANKTTYANDNAHILCLNKDQSATAKKPLKAGDAVPCNATNERLYDSSGQLIVRAQARMFYRGAFAGAESCPGYDTEQSVQCSRYEIEGQGWIDDGDGNREPSDGETSITQHHWAWREAPSNQK